jgi:antirestriction protein ArdC
MSNKVYQIITDRIIRSLEGNKVPWQKEWTASGGVPANVISGKPYRGINSLLLWSAMSAYGSPWFLTEKQALGLGGRVKSSQLKYGSLITFWKVIQKDVVKSDDSEDEEVQVEKRFVLLYYKVYSVTQCEGLKLPKRCLEAEKNQVASLPEPQVVFDNYIAANNLKVELGRPSYSPSQDVVRLPDRNAFISPESYYATAFHEAVHSTGHSSRLDRFKNEKSSYFGSETYSKEELVAELGAAFLSSQTKIDKPPVFDNSVAYIKNWLKVLKDDPRMIIFAASKAQKAADYVLGHKESADI